MGTAQAHRDADVAELEVNASEEKERAEDQMKALEKKTYDIREEMQRPLANRHTILKLTFSRLVTSCIRLHFSNQHIV